MTFLWKLRGVLQLEASAGERNAGVCVKQQLFSSKIQGVGWCDNEASVVAVVSSATGYDPPLKNELEAKPTILSACAIIPVSSDVFSELGATEKKKKYFF